MQSEGALSDSCRRVACSGLSAPQLPPPLTSVLALCTIVLFVSAISPVDDEVQKDYRLPSHVRVMAVKARCGNALRAPHLIPIALTGGIQPNLAKGRAVRIPRRTSSNLPIEDFFKSYRIRPPPNPSRQA